MKTVKLPYGKTHIELSVPDPVDVLTADHIPPIANPPDKLTEVLANPIESAPLTQLAKKRDDAVIVVSDNTRPVPYSGPDGILATIITLLKQNGIMKITLLVGCGTHRPMMENELRNMLGKSAFQPGVKVINHVCTDTSTLRSIGSTDRTPDVAINRHYLDASLKIVTGLVEPHFMAGYSGGRKAICPGISGQSVTFGFHSASILNHPLSQSLVMDGNPCHEESLKIAKMAGVDFNINVTIDGGKRINGIFCGALEPSHRAAARHLDSFTKITLNKRYQLAVTQAGDVGINHYQCAKAVKEAAQALIPGGKIILVADLCDPEPVGSGNYRKVLRQLRQLGPKEFLKRIVEPDWTFVPDQWQVQMWAKSFQEVEHFNHVTTCAGQLEHEDDDLIPEINQARRIKRHKGETTRDYTQRMTQASLNEQLTTIAPEQVVILPDGPYSIPEWKGNE